MADVSQLSAGPASPNKSRRRKNRSQASQSSIGIKAAAKAATEVSTSGQDVTTAKAARTQVPVHASQTKRQGSDNHPELPSTSAEKSRSRPRRKSKAQVAESAQTAREEGQAANKHSEQAFAAVDDAAPKQVLEAEIELDAVPTLSKRKGKGRASEKELDIEESHAQTPDQWQHLRLSEPLGSSSRVPPVFSHDGRLCFVAAASAVRIYLLSTNQLLSSLNLPALQQNSKTIRQTRNGANEAPVNEVTGLFIHPSNILQLVTTSLDGVVRVWDYTEGRVLYKFSTGGPIPCAAVVQQNTPAREKFALRSSLFLAVNRIDDSEYRSGIPVPTSIVYCLPLRRTQADKKVRLGKCKDAVELSLSSDGKNLVVVGRKKIHIAQLDLDEPSRSIKPAAPFISFEGFPDNHNYTKVTFTKVVCHPSQPYFATGDTRGSIRLWHILNPASLQALQGSQQGQGSGKMRSGAVPSDALTVVHWHAHAVSSLAFTPNGAYMLSGGEEAVLVIWQVESHHKEFVPRMGAPIDALSITTSQEGEQQFVARLHGGAICFVGANTLKVVKTIAGVKSVEPHNSQAALGPPLAIEPHTNRLVFQASHPSSIQFYSATLDKHVHEQDISPSNRVSRTDERPIEPVRVEHIAFGRTAFKPIIGRTTAGGELVALTSGPDRVWMATFDTWQDREYTRESHLKIWLGAPIMRPEYALVTRIDNPHGYERLSSMCFAPQQGDSPSKLATAAPDGTIKLWRHRVLEGVSAKGKATFSRANKAHPQGIWQCVYSLSYRSLEVIKTAFSPDASLLAVTHVTGKVTLWDAATGSLVRAFSVVESELGRISSVVFVGTRGTFLVAGGAKGHVVWDMLTCEELSTVAIPANYLFTSEAGSDSYIALAGASAAEISLPGLSFRMHELNFPVAQAAAYPTPTFGSTSMSGHSTPLPLIASIAKTGAVSLAGQRSALQQIRPTAFEGSNAHTALLQGATNAVGPSNAEAKPIRLFDELFGSSNFDGDAAYAAGTTSSYDSSTPALQSYHDKSGLNQANIFAEVPSHKLPSISTVWKDLLMPLVKPLSQGPDDKLNLLSVNGSGNGNGNADTTMEMDEDDDKSDIDGDQQTGDDEDKGSASKKEHYVTLPDDELIAIFSRTAISQEDGKSNNAASVNTGSPSGGKLPSDKIAGKADKKKKRKSLLATMV